jgi:DNA (cytosine-5)-methyltransferase 1
MDNSYHDSAKFEDFCLEGSRFVRPPTESPEIRAVDLFCGAGGLSLSAYLTGVSLGLNVKFQLAVDRDQAALGVYARNLKPAFTSSEDVDMMVNFELVGASESAEFLYTPSLNSGHLSEVFLDGGIDLLLAGPPCQGHSNLNNHTRRDDPRNFSYISTAALAIAADCKAVVIENVREALVAKNDPVGTSAELFRKAGYFVQITTIDGSTIGMAQTRKRAFLIATKKPAPPVDLMIANMKADPKGVLTVIKDLDSDPHDPDPFERSASSGQETTERINYLFDNDLYELPNHMRPNCHKNGHTYGSVYGRLRPDLPSGTITQGFLTMGRGRYVHPTKRRCLTPHEAARIQGFPDYFKFRGPTGEYLTHAVLSKVIGNAVPPRLGQAPCLSAMLSLIS